MRVTTSVFNNNILRGWEMVTVFVGYRLIVLTRMVWSGCAFTMSVAIGNYRLTKSFKNIAICLATVAVCLNGFYLYILSVLVEMDLFLGVIDAPMFPGGRF